MRSCKFLCLVAVFALLLSLSVGAMALEVESGSTYCFSAEDFSRGAGELLGICVTELPDPETGTVMLGSRIIRSGDILTAEQVAQMTFAPLDTESDAEAVVSYLPVFEDRVEQPVQMTISIRGRENLAPVAEDLAIETYKNLPNQGALKVSDPEGEMLTFTVTRQPRRGTVDIGEDGTFSYSPARNKVGVDSFTFTATDPQGNVSREATVTVRILKPTESGQYRDTMGLDCRFEAEWLRSTGLFEGEKVGGQLCFNPDQAVSRQEFVTMVLQLLQIDTQQADWSALRQEIPEWLKPYAAAALRSGLMSGEDFMSPEPMTDGEAAAMLQTVLDLRVSETTEGEEAVLAVMSENGFDLAGDLLTRADAAKLLYRLSKADTAGLAVYRQ